MQGQVLHKGIGNKRNGMKWYIWSFLFLEYITCCFRLVLGRVSWPLGCSKYAPLPRSLQCSLVVNRKCHVIGGRPDYSAGKLAPFCCKCILSIE